MIATYVTLSTAMDQLTTAIANKFRTSGSSNYDISQAQTAMGAVIETTVYIKFD
jgi:hypothetical protein